MSIARLRDVVIGCVTVGASLLLPGTKGYAQCSDVVEHSCLTFELTKCSGSAYDQIGYSVAIDGDYAVVGSNWAGATNKGTAYVYYRSGGSWTYQGELQPSDVAANWNFGHSVAISGDRIVVGAILASGNPSGPAGTGSAYVFKRSGTSWSQEAEIYPSDGATGDNYGWSVAIDSTRVVVGAQYDTHSGYTVAGSAYVFSAAKGGDSTAFDGGATDLEAMLTVSSPAAEDGCGYSVAIKGGRIAMGCQSRAPGGTVYAGSVVVFFDNESDGFDAGSGDQEAEMYASNKAEYSALGERVAMTSDRIIAGAPDHNAATGSAYIFFMGKSAPTNAFNNGSADEEAALTAVDGQSGDWFGESVGITTVTFSGQSKPRVIVGSPGDDDALTNGGSAYVFQPTGGWKLRAKLTAPNPIVTGYYGWSAAINGDTAVVGVPALNGSSQSAGKVYVHCVAYGK